MRNEPPTVELNETELREITGYAAECALRVLPVFEAALPEDPRPREAITEARAFASGGPRSQALRESAWAAFKAGKEAPEDLPGVADAARSASHAAAAAFLHPKSSPHQVKHILGATVHVALVEELTYGNSAVDRPGPLDRARGEAPPAVRAVLARYPAAPPGGGRFGELLREFDTALRA